MTQTPKTPCPSETLGQQYSASLTRIAGISQVLGLSITEVVDHTMQALIALVFAQTIKGHEQDALEAFREIIERRLCCTEQQIKDPAVLAVIREGK